MRMDHAEFSVEYDESHQNHHAVRLQPGQCQRRLGRQQAGQNAPAVKRRNWNQIEQRRNTLIMTE